MHVKDKSCNSLQGQQLYQKRTLQHRCFPVNIPNLLGTAFLSNNSDGCFLITFYCQKKKKKRKLTERLVSFALIGLLHPPHVQAPEPASMSTTTKAFVCHLFLNFIIAKYLKQEVDDGLSVCVDEHSPCDFSATRDIKIHQCHVIKR